MEYLPNGIRLEIPSGCFPLCTDSMALAHFAGKTGAKPVLDLGSGCGTLGMLLCASCPGCHITGVEISEQAHRAAQHNIQANGLGTRMQSICDDLRRVPALFAPGSFACCISNPPYFSGGPASRAGLARREDACTLSELFQAAAWALKYGGDFFLVHRPERLAQLIAVGAQNGLEAKRLGLLRHTEGSPVALVLLQLRKGAKPGLKMEDWILRDASGAPTTLYREIYHIQEE